MMAGIYVAHAKFIDPKEEFLQEMREKEFKAVLSVGWNPTYDDVNRTFEVYIIDYELKNDFYGEILQVDIRAFIRAEALFSSIQDLILAIACDIKAAQTFLD